MEILPDTCFLPVTIEPNASLSFMILDILVVGGGAAGFFGALSCALHFPAHRIKIAEKNRQVLSKVRISGGGRCNVTHACFEPRLLIQNYPRGQNELRGPFSRFQPGDTIEWFEKRGVALKAEEDGRMFPVTDDSETIIRCFLKEAREAGIAIETERGIENVFKENDGRFTVEFVGGERGSYDRLLMATGSSPKIYSLMERLGHTIVPLVPSLFTFTIPLSPFLDLSGVSVPSVEIELPRFRLRQTGPCLFTHWGLSGPAVLKLSAWAARELHAVDYKTEIIVNWVPHLSEAVLIDRLLLLKKEKGSRQLGSDSCFDLPKQLWKKLLLLAGNSEETRWAMLSRGQLQALVSQIRSTKLALDGKITYKQEFVTCGGIALDQVDFKTMESRVCPGLFFAGEILNIDGVTGGFNFQNAWTTGWIAGRSIGG